MRHADFELGLGACLEPLAAVQAEDVRNAKPFDFDLLPNLVAHGAALQFDRPMTLTLQILEDRTCTNRSDGQLFQKTFVGFE